MTNNVVVRPLMGSRELGQPQSSEVAGSSQITVEPGARWIRDDWQASLKSILHAIGAWARIYTLDFGGLQPYPFTSLRDELSHG